MNLSEKNTSLKRTISPRLFAVCFFVLFSSQLSKAQDTQKQTVETGQTTTTMPMPAGGCAYKWEVIDNPQIGFPVTSGTGDIPSFTAVNNTNKSITAHVRIMPAFDSQFAYISNTTSNTVTVFNIATRNIVKRVNVDSRPYGVAVSPDGKQVYVVSTKDEDGHVHNGTVSVIETTNNTVVGTYTVGENAAPIVVNPNGKRAYVVNETSNTVSVLDLANYNTVLSSIAVNTGPVGIGVSADGTRLYVSCISGKLYVIDTSSNQIIDQIPISTYDPRTLVVSPDGTRVYITNNEVNNYVDIVDVTARTEHKVSLGPASLFALTVTPVGDKLYITTSNGVVIMNTADYSIKKTIPLPGQLYGISVSPNGKQVLVVSQNPNTLEIINTSTEELEGPAIPNDQIGSFSVGNFVTTGIGCSTVPITYSITVNALPHIDDPGGVVVPSTHYGTVSTAPVVSVSGNSLKGPITVTAPAGFELSTDDITFNNAITVGAAGDVNPTEVFVRLKATAQVKTYNDKIVLSSPGAPSVEVPVESTVLPTQLNITADNKTKFLGDPLPVFTVTYTGFVNGDGPAQLTAPPVVTTTATASSPLGGYPINVSGAGATNYVPVYVSGILQIVTGDISTPNTFTPNGDGINDTWDIENLNLYTTCTVEVLNRYGQKIYYANGYPVPWNGMLNGKQLPVGTYYYIIRLKPDAKPLTGSINIIR